MFYRSRLIILCFLVLFICSCFSSDSDSVFSKINIPDNPEDYIRESDEALGKADEIIENIISARPKTVKNTLSALNEAMHEQGDVVQLADLLLYVSPDASIREAAQESYLKAESWMDRLYLNGQLYDALEDFQASNTDLGGEDKRFLRKILERFERRGGRLPSDERYELEEITDQISSLEVEFGDNIVNDATKIEFPHDELEGVPESGLALFDRNPSGNYLMDPRIDTHMDVILGFASNPASRLKAYRAYYSVAKDSNPQILEELIRLRDKKARILGYETHADYIVSENMAQNKETAINFLENLSEGSGVKFSLEKQTLLDLKISKTGDKSATFDTWDVTFYKQRFDEENFGLNAEAVKKYFPLDHCIKGMFKVFEQSFGIRITAVDLDSKETWHPDVRFYQVRDAASGHPLGSFYLDLYPREAKYNHFATFMIKPGYESGSGVEQRPVAAIVGNWPAPSSGGSPSQISFFDLRTLFHEFGHAMHLILTRSKYVAFFWDLQARDFIEVPSQIAEQWLTDRSVIDMVADPDNRPSPDFLDKLTASNKAFMAMSTRSMVAYGMVDLILHSRFREDDSFDVVEASNEVYRNYYMAMPDSTAYIARLGHIAGCYDANYYGYQWSDAIVLDLASLFKASDKGFLDEKLGMKLRTEIYQPGCARDENQSVMAFLGRDWNLSAYLQYLGIQD